MPSFRYPAFRPPGTTPRGTLRPGSWAGVTTPLAGLTAAVFLAWRAGRRNVHVHHRGSLRRRGSPRVHPRYRDAARALGALVARRGLCLVYGGGSVGLMGELADAALGHGGRVIGVIPKSLWAREINHAGLTELHEVGSMHERKRLMYDKSDAFIALPGGLGTLEELAEVATWSQLGLHSKPVALLDVDGFWEPLAALLDRMAGAGLLKSASRALIRRTRSAEEALAVLAAAEPAHPEKWITAQER